MLDFVKRFFRGIREGEHHPRSLALKGFSREEAGVVSGSSAKNVELEWTAKGKRVLRENPQLLQLFKFFRDREQYRYADLLPNEVEVEVDGGKALVKRIAGPSYVANAGSSYTDTHHYGTRLGVFEVTLPGGKKFAFKAGLYNNQYHGKELRSAYKARLLGLSAVEHYAKLQASGSRYYFLLMEYKPFRTIKYVPSFRGDYDITEPAKIRRLFERESKKLRNNGLYDAGASNCFVEEMPRGRARLHWFDLRMAPKK